MKNLFLSLATMMAISSAASLSLACDCEKKGEHAAACAKNASAEEKHACESGKECACDHKDEHKKDQKTDAKHNG